MKFDKKINYYRILGLTHDFEPKEIKTSYRNLSKVHHPDRGGDDEIFKKIVDAYKVLSNPSIREKYDRESEYGKNYDEMLSILDYELSNTNVAGSNIDLKKTYFKENELIHILVELDEFEEEIKFKRKVICNTCEGSGSSELDVDLFGGELECDLCNTMGEYNDNVCPGCKGEGYIRFGLGKCEKCDGKGVTYVYKKIKVKEEDFEEGKLKIDFLGHQSKSTERVGNLYIVIKSGKKREKNNNI